MPPAKRGPRFTVQDVIAAIQNGESDFEMESEDSDTDMSEEEADEDACGHMDKENQQPNDPPVSVDIEPQQHKPTKPCDRYRWYMYIFLHTIILAVINAWLLYKWECRALKMPKQEILNRRQFQADLASSLILVNTTPLKTPKREGDHLKATGAQHRRSPLNAQKRPSSGDGSPPNGAPSKRSQTPLDVRKDLMAHFPVKTKRGRCRHCSEGYTNRQCTKCDIRLCFSDDRNCFWDYHCIHI
ncbi:hypothetical protein F7725_001602 [Dissostichus mawsoni]|uniref:Uncharacterized protein n=1 Tax=Dissostichus mawsoni TaxID=36200 RepID=A0A7J5Y114_DISMA|nr:hypothetical protein F7725_001602 [Dissostichus mawsoni]